ncbi:MAG TPA: sigma-70 family RNA polymerase sigma factor, partial [Actinomycetota bacterium]|nr:sigma-70 family RNA polymerase sigma factor [Actinomycetota bacterium]
MKDEAGDATAEPRATASDRVADLYARHVPATVGFAYLLTGDRAEAEDLVHEAFIHAIGRLRHIRRPDAFEAYLMRTVVNLRISRLRRLRVERRYLERERNARVAVAHPPDVEQRDEVWHALHGLPPRQRTTI